VAVLEALVVQAARVDSAVLAGLAEAVASHHVKRLSHYLTMLKNLNRSNALRFFYFFASSITHQSFGLLNRT
jgi:hypothetical protein